MLTASLNKRFVTDMKLPITLYSEPYFSERLAALDPIYHCIANYELFCKEVGSFQNPEEYFAEYNRVKDSAINFIKSTSGWSKFNAEEKDRFKALQFNYRTNDIYKDSFRNKYFISVDIKKANFSALRQYDAGIFDNAPTWEEFLGKFTSFPTIIGSKYIRQVILGNCNPPRVISYEKYLMSHITKTLTEKLPYPVVFFSNDEVIFEIEKENLEDGVWVSNFVESVGKRFGIPLKTEYFKLEQLAHKLGYIKRIYDVYTYQETIEFKCMDGDFAHIIVKQFTGQPITENDLCVYFKGFVAQLKELPEVEIIE